MGKEAGKAHPFVQNWQPLQGNVYCPTGEGGGVDPTCSPGGIGSSDSPTDKENIQSKSADKISQEPTTPPPPGKSYKPNVEADPNKDGVTDAARVGVPAMEVPPPPPIDLMPNLTEYERHVEQAFVRGYEDNPEQTARNFRQVIAATTKEGQAPVFATDDAKILADVWSHPDSAIRSQNRATLNVALHQTANAIAKKAFVQHLDTLQPGDEIMVTVGGCGAGKGHALKNVPEAMSMKSSSKAIWDSAGDQNATENPWVQKEAESRGLKVNYVFVHADPETQWAHPKMGVVKRASDPNNGRMVDAMVFADSYAIGARNHQAFYESNKDNKNANFVFLENAAKPRLIPNIPKEALEIDRHKLAEFAIGEIFKSSAPDHVKRGATIGARIWP